MLAVLRPVYEAEVLVDLSAAMIERMREIAAIHREGVTQGDLKEAWDVTPQRVSQVVGHLNDAAICGSSGWTAVRKRIPSPGQVASPSA